MFKKLLCAAAVLLCALAPDSVLAGQRILSLEEVCRLALENNFDIQLIKYDIQISRQDIETAQSVYDALLKAELEYHDDKSAKNSTLLAGRSTSRQASASVSKKFPSGTTVTLEHAASRDWDDPAVSSVYNPGYDTSMGITVEQELGRNFFGLQDRGNVSVAVKDVEQARFLSLDKIEQTLSDVQKSYWSLVLAEDIYTLQQEFLDQAKRLYEIDQDRITHGLIEEPQLLGSEANYQQRWSDVLAAKDGLKTRENILKLQLNIGTERGAGLKPSEKFQADRQEVFLEESLKRAFKYRRDYQDALAEIARRDILVSMKKNMMWPEINLEASFTRNGLDDSYTAAADKIFNEDHPEFSTVLSVSTSLEKRDSKAEMKRAEFEKAKALLEFKNLERKIAIEIVDKIRKCEIFYERLVSLKKAADLQTRKALKQEEIFRQGRSDSDTVIRYQDDALAARVQAANAAYDYYAARIDLKRSEGTLLGTYWKEQL